MKRVFAIILNLLCLSIIQAQDSCYFFKNYDMLLNDESADQVIMNRDGDLVMLGRSGGRNFFGDGLWVVWLNICGDTLRTRFYTMSIGTGGEEGRAIFQNDDGTYTILGNQHVHSQGNSSSFLFNISEQGDSISHHIMNIGNNDWLQCAVSIGNKGYVGAGYYNLGGALSSVFIFQADSSGDILWQHDHGYPYYHIVQDLEKIPEGGYLITGYTSDTTSPFLRPFLIKTDRMGGLLWRKTYLGPYVYTTNTKVEVSNDGSYLLSATYAEHGDVTHKGGLLKLDSSGSVLSQWTYGNGTDYIGVNEFKETQGGSIIGVCYIPDTLDPDLGYTRQYRASDTISWMKDYRHTVDGTQPVPLNVMILENGDIVTSGAMFNTYPISMNFNDAFIMRSDSCGFTVGDTTVADLKVDSISPTYQTWFHNTSEKMCSSLWYFGDGDSSTLYDPVHTYTDSGYYTVTLITKAANTRDTVSYIIHVVEYTIPVIVGGIGIKGIDLVSVHPNPANDLINVEIPIDRVGAKFSLYTILGKQAIQVNLQQQTLLDISELPSGIYIYQIEHAGSSSTGKLMIE